MNSSQAANPSKVNKHLIIAHDIIEKYGKDLW